MPARHISLSFSFGDRGILSGLRRHKGAFSIAARPVGGQHPSEPAGSVYGGVDSLFLALPFLLRREKEAGTACGMDDGIRRRNYNTGNELYYKELFSAGKACGFTGAYLLTAACRLSAFLRGAVEI